MANDPNALDAWFPPPPPNARALAVQWAQRLLASADFLVLDTETTGLGARDEIVQIAVVNKNGQTVLDSLVRPTIPIPYFVSTIHGITNAHVQDAPSFADLYPQLLQVFDGRPVVVFNAPFDRRMIQQSLAKHALPALDARAFECAMLAYSRYHGERRGRSYKRKSLKFACEHEGIHNNRAHWALNDCLVTLALVYVMAGG
ncbi:MAG: 3'-5' exonuclease [Chloroflexi bacterium]|nr:3'-5' exonuclease [Chloroflexota bacterium]